MQIFLSNKDLTLSAQALDDQRLNKQIIELMQIASTVLWIKNCDTSETLYKEKMITLPTHENHPLVKWCASDNNHFWFCIYYGLDCCAEFMNRFYKSHSYHLKLYELYNSAPDIFKDGTINIFNINLLNCTTNHKYISDIHEAYRQCLIGKWDNQQNKPKWTNRQAPVWYKEGTYVVSE